MRFLFVPGGGFVPPFTQLVNYPRGNMGTVARYERGVFNQGYAAMCADHLSIRDGEEGKSAFGIACKDAQGAVDIAVDLGRLGNHRHHAADGINVLQVAVAVGGDALDGETVLMNVGLYLVGVAQQDD